MNQVKIMADSTCDLSEELIELYDITIIPLSIIMGEKSFYDKTEITSEEIFKWADENKTTPKTSAVNPEMTEKLLAPFADREVVFFGISGEMSSTCSVVKMVAEDNGFNNVTVIDSGNLSTGIGLQVIKAAKMAQNGCSAQQIKTAMEELRPKVRASFVIDTLTYLARGGRCNSVTALLANTLKLRPRIDVVDGKMGVNRKYRGHMDAVIMKYVKEMEADLLNADSDIVFITHSGCSKEIVDKVKDYLVRLDYFKDVMETKAGGVISSHCGPGTLGVLFISK